jgi:Ca2+-binding EF-hand superfamily protein
MKNKFVALPLLTATLFTAAAFAEDQAPAGGPPPPPPGKGPGSRGMFREEMIKRFDQDGNGELSDTERQAAREEMRKQWKARGEKMREEFTKRFDKDGDGKLNDAEKAEAQKARGEMRGQWGGRGFGGGPGGPGGFGFRGHEGGEPPLWMRRELHRWFEQKWGGHHGPRGHRGHGPGMGGPGGFRGKMRGELVKRFDQDGDGKLSEAERAEAKKAGGEMRAKFQEHRKEVLSRFDKDGDGKLGESERKDLREAWQKFLSQQPALKPAAPAAK